MNSPLVTVFIPVYNSERYIEEAITSIIRQTYDHLEILIIDDGSTDQSVEIIKRFEDSRIRFLQNKENKGIPYTRNVGLREANGKYLAVMDADDIAVKYRIEKQVGYLERNRNVDAVGSYYKEFGRKINKVVSSNLKTSAELKTGLIFINRIGNPTSMIRMETVHKYQLRYNEHYFVAQDYDMWVQLSKIGHLHIIPEVLLHYRMGHANITKNSNVKKMDQRKKILDSIHQDILSYYTFELTQQEVSVFCAFFNDIHGLTIDHHTITLLPIVLRKMEEQNRQYQLFEERLFARIIRSTVFTMLQYHRMTLLGKLSIYNKVCRTNTNFFSVTRDFLMILMKHAYSMVRSLFS
ncbi:glycosyltransferase family 2 protein [Oceanobacillus halophilus]|uniref:Glycosyltransferase family 2 protein n=1 Tax=Oceanobacillus halophilus TaxID=930130 RepID=A0A495A486_9BACI|nr:glycosyltransferase family A protein [Oceanobacillus halophilus]RKQ34301.1 glycosyltransferase family 2 protein [Oceanobacillus halophilus]